MKQNQTPNADGGDTRMDGSAVGVSMPSPPGGGRDAPAEPASPRPAGSRFPWRAVAVAAALIPVNTFWVQHSEVVRETAQPTMASLLFNAIYSLILLTVANAYVGRRFPRFRLLRHEMLLIYSMVSVASALAGHDQIMVLVPVMSYAFHYASPGNLWAEKLHPLLPEHLLAEDPRAIAGYWQGHASLYAPGTLKAWVGPAAWWLAFIVVLAAVMIALGTLFRRRWTHGEKLSYPLLALPMEIVDSGPALWQNRILWVGFAFAGSIDLLNGLHLFFPSLPELKVTAHDLIPVRNTPFLRAFGYLPVAFYPWAVGLGLLLPKDFLLSCWLFFWFWKFQGVAGALLGWSQVPRFPYVPEQAFGAYMGIGLFAVWMARGHLRQVWRIALSGRGQAGGGEDMSYRLALGVLAVGVLFLLLFAIKGGMSPGVAVVYFAIYLCLALSIGRMRGEMGVPAHDLFGGGPDAMLVSTLGSRAFTPNTLAMFAVLYWMTRANRSHPMPHELEGLEMGRRAGIRGIHVVGALLIAVGVGAFSGIWGALHIGYTVGIAGLPSDSPYFGTEAYGRLDSWLTNPRAPDPLAGCAIGFGCGLVLLLLWMRNTLLWWPLHPIGYAVSSSLSGAILWMPMLIAWVIKAGLLRFGGARAFRAIHPLALGLILGEFLVGGSWSIVGWVLGIKTYRFWSY